MKRKLNIPDYTKDPKYLEREVFLSDQIVNNSRSMISIINRNYIYEKVNSAFCSAHKGIRESFIGKSPGDIWGNENFQKKIKPNIDLCFTGKTVRYEASFKTPSSGKRYFEVVFRPVPAKKGEVTHLLAEKFDISNLKKSEKAAAKLKKEFRKMETNFEDRLFQAQRLETIGVLAGGISHDFNNILATIAGYAEMLREDLPKGSPSSEKTGRILSAVYKARSLTNQILTFSRQVEQEKISVSVYEILKETIGFVKSATAPEINIKAEIPKVNPNVYADPTQLFRVFLNLMTNGIQAMEGKVGTLTVSMEVVDGKTVKHIIDKDIVADEYTLLTFKYTGTGLDQSLMQRIFEPFYTTREVGKGTGLGLSVVHGIVSEMEGKILVSSKVNEGSVFSVYLPVSREYNESKIDREDRKKILFIRGNKHESRILSLALRNSGFELIFASNRKKLTDIMSDPEIKPDLVIYMIDSEKIGTGDLTGLFLKLKIKTPCILITDTDQVKLEEELVNSGIIKQHLFKPVSLKEIRNAIQISLNNNTISR